LYRADFVRIIHAEANPGWADIKLENVLQRFASAIVKDFTQSLQ
jgi:hypothetical protein